MAARQRPSGGANTPTPAETEHAHATTTAALQSLREAHDATLLALARITNPVERAKAALSVRRATTGDLASTTDDLFHDAVVEAYLSGRAAHGWYGYGALGEDLDLSRARIQQVVTGTWKGHAKPDPGAAQRRRAADQTRTVRALAASGLSHDEIAERTHLTVAQVADLTR